jgi:uncharacterized protein YndB with AHSA1/START domain
MALTTVVAASAIALAAIATAPFALPGRAHVERTAVVPAPTAAVFDILSRSAGFDSINPFRTSDPDLIVTFAGPADGVGASFNWTGKSGSGSQTIVEAVPGERVVMQLDLGAMGKPRQTFTLRRSNGGGTEVTWALDADLGANPVHRVFGVFMDKMLGPQYELGLRKLSSVAAGA